MIVLIAVSMVLIGMAFITLMNAFFLPRLRRASSNPQIAVSVLIPARNEANVIARSVEAVLKQSHTNLELIVLDDHSDDGTGEIAWQAAHGDVRLRVMQGEPLPAGWLGKNWACHQLAQAANSDILIFADADVLWSRDAIASVVAMLEQSKADLLTVWPTQQTGTWGERLIVPLMALAIVAYLPVVGVHYTASAWFAAACGQCLVFRRRAYDAVGGHATVRDNIIEDVALARRIKQKGLRLWMADGAEVIGCRMYENWRGVRNGFAKNILAGHGNQIGLLVLSALFHWGVFVLPWILLMSSGLRVWALACVVMGVGIRALSAAATRQRIQDAVLMPISVVLMTSIAAQAVWWHWHGGPQWKGRTVAPAAGSDTSPPRIQKRKYAVSSHQVGVEQ